MVDFAKQGDKGGEILREPTDTKQKVTKPGSKLMGAHDYKLNAGNSYSLNAGKGRSGSAHTDKNWIAGAIKKPGALRRQLGVPKGKKIPAKTLNKASEAGGKLGQRARLAQTLKGFK